MLEVEGGGGGATHSIEVLCLLLILFLWQKKQGGRGLAKLQFQRRQSTMAEEE